MGKSERRMPGVDPSAAPHNGAVIKGEFWRQEIIQAGCYLTDECLRSATGSVQKYCFPTQDFSRLPRYDKRLMETRPGEGYSSSECFHGSWCQTLFLGISVTRLFGLSVPQQGRPHVFMSRQRICVVPRFKRIHEKQLRYAEKGGSQDGWVRGLEGKQQQRISAGR